MSNPTEDWSHWPRYKSHIISRFLETNLYPQLNPETTHSPPSNTEYTYICGAWYKEGNTLPSFPALDVKYAKGQSMGNLIFLECLPPSIYDQIFTCNTSFDKWVKLHNLYDEYQQMSNEDTATSLNIKTTTQDNTGPNVFLLRTLTNHPKYGDAPQSQQPRSDEPNTSTGTIPTIHDHLTFLQVLYEGLVLRNAQITESEFINIIHETLSNLPMFQAFVTFLDIQAKKRGLSNVPIGELIEGVADYETSIGREKVLVALQASRDGLA